MNLTTLVLAAVLVAGGIAGGMKAGEVLIERVQRQADAGDAMIELARRGAAPELPAQQATAAAPAAAQKTDAELIALIDLAR